ncbi:MAG: hypothetical protein NTZ77_01455 [Caldiserica bacterium]|nr:hypothetical protein [Caldisericota bacterium]
MMHPDESWFRDEAGRTLLLRGVNLGGDSKVPVIPDGATHLAQGFFDHRMVSFVGRPFPLSEAVEHLSRLKSWGLTLLRFLVTWEAIEHAGPGLYDTEYLEYVERVVQLAGDSPSDARRPILAYHLADQCESAGVGDDVHALLRWQRLRPTPSRRGRTNPGVPPAALRGCRSPGRAAPEGEAVRPGL